MMAFRIFGIIVFLVLSVSANAQCALGPPYSTSPIRACEFGASPSATSVVNQAAFQAAIDFAYATANTRTVSCQAGAYRIDPPLYVDAPGNLRTNPSSPTIFTFAASFVGEEGLGSGQNARGCVLDFTRNDGCAVWVGPGNGNLVKSIQIVGPETAYRGQLPSTGIGVCIAGGPGGANRSKIEGVEIDNFYTLIQTGVNNGSLGAENKFIDVNGTNCKNGIVVGSSQNDINTVERPSIACTNNFIATVGPGISVFGGNVSTPSGQYNSFALSGVSVVTAAKYPGTNVNQYSFSVTLDGVDSYLSGCGNCVYTSFIIKTPHFGLVPMTMTAWNDATHTATFRTLLNWGAYYFQFNGNALTQTNFQADILAATTVYAVEQITTFTGSSFNIQSVHVENPDSCTTFINDTSGYNGDHGITVTNARFNYDPALSSFSTASNPALFYCQQSFPFISMDAGAGNILWQNSNIGQGPGSNPLIIDMMGPQQFRSIANGNRQGFYNPVIRSTGIWGGQQAAEVHGISGDGLEICTAGYGCGEWDRAPFGPPNPNAAINVAQSRGLIAAPYVGYRAAPWAMPRLYGPLLSSLQASPLPPLGAYWPINGMTLYGVLDWNADTGKLVQSAHRFDSYGQALTTANIPGLSWSYQGQTPLFLADAGTLSWVYPGLGIMLDSGDGSGPQHYVVTGVFPHVPLDCTHPGYFTALNAQGDASPVWLEGLMTATFTGTVIGQDAFSWKSVTLQ